LENGISNLSLFGEQVNERIMKKITLIGGEPCTGKSTLMRSIIKRKNINKNFEYEKLLKGHCNEDYIVLGLYGGELFDGTDKLSMAVQPVFERFINKEKTKKHIILEGDRLFKKSLIRWLQSSNNFFRLIILTASESVKSFRHKKRKDEQTQKWINAKKTTINNITSEFNHTMFKNENMIDMDKIIDYILQEKNNIIQRPNQFNLF